MTHREKKLRGIPRRMRSLKRWSLKFKDFFPSQAELAENPRYWNWKLPIHPGIVEGRNSTPQMKRDVAQLLINACGHLIANKPAWARNYRITSIICLPNLFNSEICIFVDEAYFAEMVAEGDFPVNEMESKVVTQGIHSSSLAEKWRLDLPPGVWERGIQVSCCGLANGEGAFNREDWMFGEVLDDGFQPCFKRAAAP